MDETASGLSTTRRLSWRDVYDALAAELLRYLWHLTRDREVATDLMQDTFLAAMRDEGQLRDPNKVHPWLYRIATRLATRRLQRARLVAFLPFSGREQSERGEPDIERIAVRAALAAVSPDQAVALVLHYAHGFTRTEIAEITGRSEETIKSRIARGKGAFLAAYDEHGGQR
ncbi:MAG TPA: RNA polymerase sigma factor [Candidatus Limnocylindria bacterium]|nr:RNA polymerase sigma factor [Candidatus Limnocylindria bacterium]